MIVAVVAKKNFRAGGHNQYYHQKLCL